jgi:surface antigen
MYRTFLLAAPLLLIPVSLPSTPVDGAAIAQSRTGEQCQRRNEGRRQAGSAIGGIARGLLGRVGGGAAANIVLPMSSMLGDAIMNMLDCHEQEQAAAATETAVRGGNVGDSATWQSETRPGVTGTSTVTAVNNNSADGQCMTVTDVVIVDGEETRAPKQMCRRPPSNRYVRV